MKNLYSKKYLLKIATFCAPFIMAMSVNAASSGTMEFIGENNFDTNSRFYQDIIVTSVSGNINAISGQIKVENESCFTFDYLEELNDGVGSYLNKFMYVSYNDGITSTAKLVRAHFKATDSVCSTKIYLERPTIAFIDNTSIRPTNVSKIINVLVNDEPKVVTAVNNVVEEKVTTVDSIEIKEIREVVSEQKEVSSTKVKSVVNKNTSKEIVEEKDNKVKKISNIKLFIDLIRNIFR